MLIHIDIFSGIGGFALAAQWAGFKTVAFCEIEPYCQEIIKQNFGAVLADAFGARLEKRASIRNDAEPKRTTTKRNSSPILYPDIRSFPASDYRGATLLTGGFPCQPFSQAGKRRGKEDDRYLWPEMLRVISEARPAWVLGENVAGIVQMELDRVLSDLEGEGYACQSLVIPACAVDAKHRRDRVWIVAYRSSEQRTLQSGGGIGSSREKAILVDRDGQKKSMADPKIAGERTAQQSGCGNGFEQNGENLADAESDKEWWIRKTSREQQSETGRRSSQSDEVSGPYSESSGRFAEPRQECCEWLPEPGIRRVANGIPFRVHRLKGLGNAIVPQVAYEIIKEIAEIENGRHY